MGFKSEAQRRRFTELVKAGKMKQSLFDELDKATNGPIPERVAKPAAASGSKTFIRRRHSPV